MYPLLKLAQALAKFFRGFQPWRGQDLANAAERKVITMTEIGAGDLGDALNIWRLYIFCKVSTEGRESPGQTGGAIPGQHSRLLPPSSPSGFLSR